jgi:hypothetical protein
MTAAVSKSERLSSNLALYAQLPGQSTVPHHCYPSVLTAILQPRNIIYMMMYQMLKINLLLYIVKHGAVADA